MNMLSPIEVTPVASTRKPHRPNGEARLKGEILEALTRLDGGAGKKVSRGVLRDGLIASGALETDAQGHMTSSARHKFSRAMVALRGKHGALREHNGVVWRVGAVAERERAVAIAIAKERSANIAAIAERDRAIEAWKRAGAIAKEREAKVVADLERRLTLAGERATNAEQKLADAAARERMVAALIAEFGGRLAVLASKPRDGEPSFQD